LYSPESEVRMAGIYGTFGNAERLLTCKTLECLSNFKSITSTSVFQGVLIFKRTTLVGIIRCVIPGLYQNSSQLQAPLFPRVS
jgi:cbb3-type cytochrome oxidase subunit 1